VVRIELCLLTVNHLQLAQQLVAALHFVHVHHDLQMLGPKDKIREPKEQIPKEGTNVI
jgi:hypothetical protein